MTVKQLLMLIGGLTIAACNGGDPDERNIVVALDDANDTSLSNVAAADSLPLASMPDTFDVNNVEGAYPLGWVVSQPSNTHVIVSKQMHAPDSAPFSVELSDASASERPEMYSAFSQPTSAGSVSVQVRIDELEQGPMSMQLYSNIGVFLGAIVVSSNGYVGYDVGAGTVTSSVAWQPGTWFTLRLDWFENDEMDAYVGAAKVADRVHFASSGDPGRVAFTAGFSTKSASKAHIDDVVLREFRAADDFEQDQLGGNPSKYWLSAASGTHVKVIGTDTIDLGNGSRALELVDESSTARVEAVRSFTSVAEGDLTLKVLVPTQTQAPFDVHLRTQSDAFLAAFRFGTDGKLSYNASPAGAGPFTASTLSFSPGSAQTLRIEWTGQDTFFAFVDGVNFANMVPFATHGDPAKVGLIAGTSASAGKKAYVDSVVVANRPIHSVRGRYMQNAVWLAHCYANSARCIGMVPDLLRKLHVEQGVRTIFLNVGSLLANGTLKDPTTRLSQLVPFLDAVNSYETAHAHRFQIIAWLNGSLEANNLDLAALATRTAIVDETERFISALAPGSYVAAASRSFDGVQFDLEPSGARTSFDNHKLLVQETRSAWNALAAGDKDIGIAAHELGAGSEWAWPPAFFYEIAPLVNHIAAMTYTSGLSPGPVFREWIHAQTRDVLTAVSGEYWADSSHPPPAIAPRVFIGFPAMPASRYHHPSVENVFWAAPGVDLAMAELIDSGRQGAQFFEGAAMYLHSDGSGSDGYASWSSEWADFSRYWLGR